MSDKGDISGPTYAGRAVLTKEAIFTAALEIAGNEGFPALTMRRLAAELDVTVRALYHHVSDRQEVIDGVARLLVAQLPKHRFDPDDWRESIRRMFREAREVYRRHPRAVLIGIDERVSIAGVEPERLLAPERMIAFLREIGLSLPEALALQTQLLTQVLGFVLSIDYSFDRADEKSRERMLDPVPGVWLDAYPDLPVPHMREAAAAPPIDSDAMFEQVLDGIVLSVEARLGLDARHS